MSLQTRLTPRRVFKVHRRTDMRTRPQVEVIERRILLSNDLVGSSRERCTRHSRSKCFPRYHRVAPKRRILAMKMGSSRMIRALAVLILLSLSTPPSRAGIVYPDPVGDTFGVGPVQHDITSIGSTLTATDLIFNVTFADTIAPASAASPLSVVGFLDIDIDRNPATGVTDADSGFTIARGGVPAKSGLGVEVFLDLFSESATPGSVDLVNVGTLTAIGSAPITFDPHSLSIDVPLALLGGNGQVNYGITVGTFDEATDEARNPGLSPATSVPEPSSLVLLGGSVVCLAAVYGRRIRN